MSASWSHALALTADGRVWAWGGNDTYALGVEPKGGRQVLVLLKDGTLRGWGNTFAVKTDGSLWGWGAGDKGRWPFQANTKIPTAITLP